jgi:hypothetical protein
MSRPDFTTQGYFRNPAPAIERLRAAGPVIEVKFPIVGRVWIITTQELASRVLKDSVTFTCARTGRLRGPMVEAGADPHRRRQHADHG